MTDDESTVGAAVFAAVARTLGDCARAVGLQVPAFRSPPRIPGAVRTIRRYPGGAVIAVRVRDRPLAAVVDDMVEGVLVTNHLSPPASSRLGRALRDAVRPPEIDLRVPGPPSLRSGARMAERQTQAA